MGVDGDNDVSVPTASDVDRAMIDRGVDVAHASMDSILVKDELNQMLSLMKLG